MPNVTFWDAGHVLGSAPVDGVGQATFATPALAPGLHQMVATFITGQLDLPNFRVVKADTVATLSASPNPALTTDAVTLSVRVNVVAPGGAEPRRLLPHRNRPDAGAAHDAAAHQPRDRA